MPVRHFARRFGILPTTTMLLVQLCSSARRVCNVKAFVVFNCAFLTLNVLLYLVLHGWPTFSRPIESYFASPMTSAQRREQDDAFQVFLAAMTANNITFFIFSGSLLGSYRHHGRIPWDDDIDVMVNSSDKPRMRAALSRLSPLYRLSSYPDDVRWQWKFFRSDGRHVVFRRHLFPYIDVFFFSENETHVWNDSPSFEDECWPKRWIFPLRPRPFGSVMVPAPCDSEAVLAANLNAEVCQTRAFSHAVDLPMILTPVSVACEELYHAFPFVRRTAAAMRRLRGQWGGSGTGIGRRARYQVETLAIGKWTLQNVTLLTGC